MVRCNYRIYPLPTNDEGVSRMVPAFEGLISVLGAVTGPVIS